MNEEKFILNAARLNLSDENIALLKDISSKDIDWDILSKKASFHGVSTFIYYSLKKHNLTHIIPAYLFNKLKENYYLVGLRNLKFIKKIQELSNIIEEKIVLLKGGYLIDNFYPDIGIRSMCDIDILVERNRAVYIWNLLKSKGFVQHGPQRQSIAKSTAHNKVVPFQHLDLLSSDNCDVEIHSNLFENHDFFYETEMAFKKAISVNSNNTLCRLSNEFFLIHLCSHFYLHNYLHKQIGKNLRMLCDINEFILKRGHDIDWNEIDEVCFDPELKNRISTTLTYAYYFLQTPIPVNFIVKNLINENLTSIDSLINKNMAAIKKQKSNLSRFFSRLKRFDKPLEIFVFIFRTFIPEKEWIKAGYNTKNFRELIMSYFSYWSDLFTRYILNRDVKSGK